MHVYGNEGLIPFTKTNGLYETDDLTMNFNSKYGKSVVMYNGLHQVIFSKAVSPGYLFVYILALIDYCEYFNEWGKLPWLIKKSYRQVKTLDLSIQKTASYENGIEKITFSQRFELYSIEISYETEKVHDIMQRYMPVIKIIFESGLTEIKPSLRGFIPRYLTIDLTIISILFKLHLGLITIDNFRNYTYNNVNELMSEIGIKKY